MSAHKIFFWNILAQEMRISYMNYKSLTKGTLVETRAFWQEKHDTQLKEGTSLTKHIRIQIMDFKEHI